MNSEQGVTLPETLLPGIKTLTLSAMLRDGEATNIINVEPPPPPQSTTSLVRHVVAIAINDKYTSMQAFKWYLEWMHSKDNKVLLVNINRYKGLEFVEFEDGSIGLNGRNKSKNENELQKMCKSIAEFTCMCKKMSIQHELVSRSRKDSVGKDLVEIFTEYQVSWVVLGNGNNNAFGRRLLGKGTVCDYLSTKSPFPVTVVPVKVSLS